MEKQSMLFTRRSISRIILPLVAQNLLAIAIGMADSMMVSNKGEEAFAGVSLVGSLDAVLITLFGALSAGGSVVLAQAIGHGDRKRACDGAKQLVYISVMTATAIALICIGVRAPLLRLLFGNVEAGVMQNALAYFTFLTISFPFLAIEQAVSATFCAQGESMISLKISLLMNVINIGGNAILIYGVNLGAAGAAIATLISRIIGATVMVTIAHGKSRYIYLERLFHYRPNGSIIKDILRIGVPNSLENTMFQFGRLMTSSLVSSLGTVAIAANAAALSLANVQYNAGAAVQSTMVAVVGRCVGAQEKEQAKHYTWSLLGVGYALLAVVIGALCLFAAPLLRLYGLSGETSALARQLLLYHGAVSVVIWAAAFCLPNAFRAANDVKFTMVVSVASRWVLRVALGYVIALETVSVFGLFELRGMGMGVMGVWVSATIDWVLRTVLFAWRFLSGKWLHRFHLERKKPKTA